MGVDIPGRLLMQCWEYPGGPWGYAIASDVPRSEQWNVCQWFSLVWADWQPLFPFRHKRAQQNIWYRHPWKSTMCISFRRFVQLKSWYHQRWPNRNSQSHVANSTLNWLLTIENSTPTLGIDWWWLIPSQGLVNLFSTLYCWPYRSLVLPLFPVSVLLPRATHLRAVWKWSNYYIIYIAWVIMHYRISTMLIVPVWNNRYFFLGTNVNVIC